MTDNEAIELIEKDLKLHSKDLSSKYKNGLRMAIQALEEIQAYRAIGTVEELQALKEKNKPKKSKWKYYRKENIATCNNCSYEHYLGTYHQYATNYCPNCGSKMTET